MHILFGGSQFHKTAALAAGTFAQKVTFSADIQTAVILLISGTFFSGHGGYHLGYFFVYSIPVYLGKKASFTERSAHFTVTLTTEQGGISMVRTHFSNFTL